jgi:hypothetical protein
VLVANLPMALNLAAAVRQLDAAVTAASVQGLVWVGSREQQIAARFQDTASALEFVRRFQGRELPGGWRLELEFEPVTSGGLQVCVSVRCAADR